MSVEFKISAVFTPSPTNATTMTPLAQLAYCSSAVHLLSDAQLGKLLQGARKFNESVGVSGALLYNDGSFFQYIEGPTNSVAEVYDRIKAASQHKNIIQLLAGPCQSLHFTKWHMGFVQVPHSTLHILAQADWLTQRESLKKASAALPVAPGVRLLLKFWHDAVREPDVPAT